MVKVNINRNVSFKLTADGMCKLSRNHEFIVFSNVKGDGYEMQLHDFMRVVGPHLILGNPTIIENCEIEIEET